MQIMRRKANCRVLLYTCSVLLLTACSIFRQHKSDSISPLDYGLRNAQTGEERFEILYKTHSEAIRLGKTVDYSGIKRIDLVIPKGAKSIPLAENTNFKGVTITVVNNNKKLFLFEYTREMHPITIKAQDVDKQNYTAQELKKGLILLSITDENLWVANREGFNYGATRKDIVLIENGKGLDSPCSPYSTTASSPSYLYRSVTNDEKSFENLVFKRLPGSTYMTKLVKFSNENNIRIEDITVTTPEGTLFGDQVIRVENCSNILIKGINIDGTYSTKEKYGYGISLNTVWNVECTNIQANAPWGVFGDSNVHKIHLKNCNVNRFDIHCYGKDVLCEDCTFIGTGGVYSSVYGKIEYRRCTFNNDACPYLNRADYNAYVFFDIVLKDCIVNPLKDRPYLFNLRTWSDKINEREELRIKCWPNVLIENLIVNLPEDIDAFDIFRVPRNYTNKETVAGLSAISIKGLVFKYKKNAPLVSLRISSTEVQLENPLVCSLDGVNLLSGNNDIVTQSGKTQKKRGSLVVNMKSSKGEDVTIVNSHINNNNK